MLRLFFLSIFLVSCSSIKPTPKSIDELLSSLRVTGEGRGRLGAEGHEYVVSVEALLKDQDTYLLALNIPTRGEEVLELKSLKNATASTSEILSFQKRIKNSLNPKFLLGMRSLLRLALARELKLNPSCTSDECRLEKEVFQVSRSKEKLLIEKVYEDGSRIQMEGENLTDTIFSRTNFRLISPSVPRDRMSFELFWST
jgi:hypothetical protein